MRETKFRGYSKSRKQWLVGSLIHLIDDIEENDGHVMLIFPNGDWEDLREIDENNVVEPDSVGQSTGLKDKNGVEIYEGDIVEHEEGYGMRRSVVTYSEGMFTPLVSVEYGYNAIDRYEPECYEVIGNIHQNPELLEESV